MKNGVVSVVIPAYNEAKNISKTTVAIEKILSAQKIAHEILFVDDGSSDDTWEIIKKESAKNQNIKGINSVNIRSTIITAKGGKTINRDG